ncbi:AsmA-like C-terminal region-containing protein [Sulfitobacter noctilucae]|uniref:YhdP family protein n=1 Tax=Sulfitobacter noctilucae TaxID=1342302 RepID=UPI0013768FF4|nr:AsmA-like C-terminal region-containing protein [Sulfitobacter noctilucae]
MSKAKPLKSKKQKVPKSKAHHVSLGVMWLLNLGLGAVTVAVLLLGGLVFYLKNYAVTAPGWVQTRIEARIAKELPLARVSFGEMAFVMEEGWRPRIRLRDVNVDTAAGAALLRVNEFKATFANAPLMRGQVQPSHMSLSGITAVLRRKADGSFALQTGLDDLRGGGASLPEIITQMDAALQTDTLSTLTTAEIRALTLRYEDESSGRVWTVDGGRLVLTRDAGRVDVTADLAVLDGGVGVATLAANYSSQIGETSAEFGAALDGFAAQDIAAQGPAFAWLGVLQAPIAGNVRGGLNADGSFAPVAATLQIAAGAVRPNDGTPPIPFDQARSYFSYDPAAKLLTFDELSVRSKWITGQATGTAVLGVDAQGGKLTDLVGQIRLTDLSANPAGLYDAPVQMAGANLDFRLELDPFRVTLGNAQITDLDKTLLVSGAIGADPEGWRVSLDGRMDALDRSRLMTLWPERAVPRTRAWLAANLQAGRIRNIDLALRRSPDAAPQTYLAFDFAETDVKFARNLPPVTDGRGHFSLSENRLVIALDTGKLSPPTGGDITVTGSSFIIPDVTATEGTPSVVRLRTRSSITAALSLLNLPPLSVMDKVKQPVALADGEALLEGTLALPLRPGQKPQVDYFVTGELVNLRSDQLVKGREINADRLDISVDNRSLRITGPGTLDGVPFEADYRQPIGVGAGPAKLTAQVALTPKTLTAFNVALPPGSVSGRATADVLVTLAKGRAPELSLTSDLVGLRVAVPAVSWSKAANRAGRLDLGMTLSPVPVVDRLALTAPGLEAQGDVSFNADKSLERVRFDRLRVGDWLDVPVDLLGRGAGRPLQLALRGGTLDLRRAEFGASDPNPAAPAMDVRLDSLRITDTIALTGLQGRFDTKAGLDGSFKAQLNGAAPVQGRVLPQGGRSAVRLVSGDAGAVLRAAGLVKQVVGGDLSLVLLPVGSGGAFDGRLEVGDVRIKDAPAIAALLNAVSVVGLVNELNGDGIYFDDVEASFRLTPNRLTLTEGSAVGASMGLSMDGTYALDQGTIAMQGVISPVYLLNGIGSLFTRKGEGLIGFNYALSGPAKEPRVSVNPLSALTPAMFREIFRSPPPDLPPVDGITESTLPQAARPPKRPVADSNVGR